MTLDPTTPERRTIRVQVMVDTDELREWAGKHADAGHHGVAQALYNAAEGIESQILDLDDAECEIERQRGDLAIERRRAGAAEAALDRVRKYAREQRLMADALHSIGRPYDALPYDNTATTLERKIGDRT